ncbi:MAG: hypothetical protein V2J26_11845 [Pacificimonas sp.]|jgi:hypothetical protein|nr:hypothetical protein [Pacificimonas sp.]
MTVTAFGDMLYDRLFPAALLAVLATGVFTFALQEASAALNCFIAVFFGVRLDTHIAVRKEAESEAAAQRGWARLRGPARGA